MEEKVLHGWIGCETHDLITGFKGVVTGYAQYMTGCDQFLVHPREVKDGNYPEARWFDEQRLALSHETDVLSRSAKLVLGPGVGGKPGACGEAPKK